MPWTLDEYLEATEDEFFNDVSPNMDALEGCDSVQLNRSDVVKTKYYYAGGSCRDMFYFNTVDVMKKLHRAVDMLNDIATFTTTGLHSRKSANRLFAMFKDTRGVGKVLPVLSDYAAAIIGVNCATELIKKFMVPYQGSSNPVLTAWMLEMVFFSSIQNGGLDIVDRVGIENCHWKQAPVVFWDRKSAIYLDRPIWIKPGNWKQGGYDDAIMVNKEERHVL